MQLDADALAAMLAPIIAGEVAKAVEPLQAEIDELKARKPEPGPPGDKGEPGERGEKGEDGADGSNGRDGAGIVDGFVSRDGHLIATLSDGSTRDFGQIIGKDGRDGADGKDGRDGFSLTDFDCAVLEDDRTIEFKFIANDIEHTARLMWPTVIDRGVYKEGECYAHGDAVTWGGSLWIAQKSTDSKPDTADSGWRLAVKRGRDGKDARKD